MLIFSAKAELRQRRRCRLVLYSIGPLPSRSPPNRPDAVSQLASVRHTTVSMTNSQSSYACSATACKICTNPVQHRGKRHKPWRLRHDDFAVLVGHSQSRSAPRVRPIQVTTVSRS